MIASKQIKASSGLQSVVELYQCHDGNVTKSWTNLFSLKTTLPESSLWTNRRFRSSLHIYQFWEPHASRGMFPLRWNSQQRRSKSVYDQRGCQRGTHTFEFEFTLITSSAREPLTPLVTTPNISSKSPGPLPKISYRPINLPRKNQEIQKSWNAENFENFLKSKSWEFSESKIKKKIWRKLKIWSVYSPDESLKLHSILRAMKSPSYSCVKSLIFILFFIQKKDIFIG